LIINYETFFYHGINCDQIIITKIQKWIKRLLLSRKLIKLSNNQTFLSLYWHPDAKGGFFHIKNMYEKYKNHNYNGD
jgi:hypothetical protein